MMGEVLTQPEKPEVDAFPTEPVEQSTAQVKLVRHEWRLEKNVSPSRAKENPAGVGSSLGTEVDNAWGSSR